MEPGPAHSAQASAFLCGALDCGRDMSNEDRAFSRWELWGFFEATGKRLIEVD